MQSTKILFKIRFSAVCPVEGRSFTFTTLSYPTVSPGRKKHGQPLLFFCQICHQQAHCLIMINTFIMSVCASFYVQPGNETLVLFQVSLKRPAEDKWSFCSSGLIFKTEQDTSHMSLSQYLPVCWPADTNTL